MKLILLVVLTFITFFNFAQTDQKSLLWKITHKNTKKVSYLYGTMHISGRLAFHLGEEFFEAIESVDAVALESNPIIWLDEIMDSPYADNYLGAYGFKNQTYEGFYQESFKLTIPDNKNLSGSISSDHYLTNWMLYRSKKGLSDFQEETFLDLFIYQAGMKFGKNVYSLENFKQTNHFSKMGNMTDPNKKEKAAWYEKLTEDKYVGELIRDAYRNKDILLLDSLHSQINSDNFMKWMLDVRNDIMSVRIDSFIQKENTSLFIGIGAAHLAGEKGVINYLRNKGYSVEPMSTTITDKVKETKEAYDKKKTDINYNHKFENELFSLSVPGTMYETPSSSKYQRQFFSPELTNGSYYSVKTLSTYSYLSNIKHEDYLLKIDSILFESVPGDIISKKRIKKNGFDGLDIVNKTTTGNFQRYQIFFTPLNILIFKMGGKDSFVNQMSEGFFNSIKLKELSSNWTNLTVVNNDFEISLPAYYTIKGNKRVTSLYHHFELEAYDKSDENYYFLKRASLYDYDFIEEDKYELNRIAEQFCDELDIDSINFELLSNTEYPTGLATAFTPDSNYLSMKIVIKGAFYYLLANVSPVEKQKNKFFDSFHFHDLTYNYKFETKADSTLLFTTKSNYIFPTIYTDKYVKAYRIHQKNESKEKEDDSYKGQSEERVYFSENFERIVVNMYKFHDYTEYKNVDSLWSWQIRNMKSDNLLILKDKKTANQGKIQTLDANFIDTNSCRMIKTKYVLNNGIMYSLYTTLDTISAPSQFIHNFYDSFTPIDTAMGISIFDDKSELFFDHIFGSDSLKTENALKAVRSYINFDKDNIVDMKKMIDSYNFPDKHIEVKKQLITDLGKIDDKNILPYLINLYPKFEDTAMYQLAILRALSKQKNKKAYQQFVKLLDKDIPLASDDWGIKSIFYPFNDSLSIAKEIYPEILGFTFVDSYKTPAYKLLSVLVIKNKIKGKNYKKKYKQILREAKIELKSQISYEQAQKGESQNSYYYKSYKNNGNELLVDYATLLMPFYKKTAVKDFFEKLTKAEDYTLKTDIYVNMIIKKISVPKSIWLLLAKDDINRSYLYERLESIERLDLFPNEYKFQKLMVESLLYNNNFNFEKDSMIFVDMKEIIFKNDTGFVYFYKSKGEKDDDWELDYVGLQPINKDKTNIKTIIKEKGIKIEKHKTIEEIIEEELETIQLSGHKRAKAKGKENFNFWR